MRYLIALLSNIGCAASLYVGSEACKPCHRQEYDRQIRSHHAQALRAIAESPVAAMLGAISDPQAKLEWAFGAGVQGITPVGRIGHQYFENRLSYYRAAKGLAITFGHPENATAKLGILQTNRAITACFNCHSTGVRPGLDGPDLSDMRAGVSCERCHGPGRRHVESHGRFSLATAQSQIQMCGECHRLPAPEDTTPEPELADPVNLRFAPVGLMASSCFTKSRQLSCTTCHNPHEDARPRTSTSYTDRCVGCHKALPKLNSHCRRAAKENCLPCHMRQASLGPYLKFTDHRVRIY